jgi:4-amino-4-deoxy-L-arabinose transferase-like glycosyltransferase
MLPFAGLSLLAACLPTTDFDALAYHLLGPKEYFTAGRITFLPHNIYTTFPFFTEMFALLGMTVASDWYLGGLVGQVVLWSFGPFTALAVGRLAGRSFGSVAGWLAATAYMTTPWVYRLSVIPYVEGAMLFYGVLALDHATRRGSHAAFLAGCFSGCAVACKYPGLVMVAVPAAVAMLSIDPKRFPSLMLRYSIGMLIFAGPWLVRNYAWTGNPVYPLAYPLFGGIDLNDAQAARFANAHAPSDYRLASFLRYLFEIVARSDWQSGLIFAFAPLAMLHRERRRALAYWGLVVYLFLAFWALTHRLDRFWLTLEPILAILAGAGMAWSRNWLQRTMVGGTLLLTMIYNLAYCSTALCGLPNYTIDLREQREWNSTRLWPAVAMANDPQLIARDETVLFVGFAGIYDALVAARYNTVFDDNLLERWAHNEAGQRKAAAEIRQKLQQEGIDAIVVDWSWIERYRSPGNYGYADAITRDLFESLTRERVLTKVYPQVDHGPVELYRVVDGESD